MNHPKTREELLAFIEGSIADFRDWKAEDAAEKTRAFGSCWSLLKSGVPFGVFKDPEHDEYFWVFLPTVFIDEDSNRKGYSRRFSVREKQKMIRPV